MYKKDRSVIIEKNRQSEIMKHNHESKTKTTLTIIHYQAFIICFNPILWEWKQKPDFIKGKHNFLLPKNHS